MKNSTICTLGLISDTHFQDRLFTLPPTLERYFTGVDLILHAGDVGGLDILDLLGRFAPTIAVHGNDESDDAKRDLPEQQLVAFHGVRILLWHSHYPDPIEEKANRKGVWRPKIARIAARGRERNAHVVVYGHTHVPIVHIEDGVFIINPGALAAGSYFTRQAMRSVAKLQIYADGKLKTSHFNVDMEQEIILDELNLDEQFHRLAGKYQEWIVEPDMINTVGLLQKISYEDIQAVVLAIMPLYKQSLQNGLMRQDDVIRTIKASNLITPNDKKNILSAMEKH
jgi:putative phosphoesterase